MPSDAVKWVGNVAPGPTCHRRSSCGLFSEMPCLTAQSRPKSGGRKIAREGTRSWKQQDSASFWLLTTHAPVDRRAMDTGALRGQCGVVAAFLQQLHEPPTTERTGEVELVDELGVTVRRCTAGGLSLGSCGQAGLAPPRMRHDDGEVRARGALDAYRHAMANSPLSTIHSPLSI